MAVPVDSKEFQWAVIYLIGCAESPFCKAPIVPNTVLAAQAVVGLTQEARFMNCNGTVANNVKAQYKRFMFCSPEFFAHVDGIVDLTNSLYNYLRSDPGNFYMTRETAYAFCVAMFPPTTDPGRGLHAVLSLYEVKALTGVQGAPADQEPIRFFPHKLMEEDVIK